MRYPPVFSGALPPDIDDEFTGMYAVECADCDFMTKWSSSQDDVQHEWYDHSKVDGHSHMWVYILSRRSLRTG